MATNDPTLALRQQNSNIGIECQPESKPGRKVHSMGYGNVSGKKQKGIYLSRVSCDMVEQLSIVTGKTESAVHEDSIREYFMRIKAEYEKANIKWNQVLESHGYVIPKWQR